MLSPNSILHQGRYRITRNISDTAAHSLYGAHDNLFGQDVIVYEGPDPRKGPKVVDRDVESRRFTAHFNHLRTISHYALAELRDHFYHADRKYIVTEPVDGRTVTQLASSQFSPIEVAVTLAGLSGIVDAFTNIAISDSSVTSFQCDPAFVCVTPAGEFKYLFFGSDSTGDAVSDTLQRSGLEFAFMPIEVVWPRLDLASQKAISNSYDERSLDVLESARDFRSDIAGLGSIAYFLVTGALPHGVLERSIEILDGNADPLAPPHLINSEVSKELSDVIMKAMCLNREERFDGFETFARHLQSLVTTRIESPSVPTDIFEEIDLLEIPRLEHTIAVAAAAPVAGAFGYRERQVPAAVAIDSHRETSNESDVSEVAAMLPEKSRAAAVGLADEREFVTLSPMDCNASSEPDLFSSHVPKRSRLLGPAAIVTVLLVIAAFGGWLAFSTLTVEKASAVTETDTRSTLSPETSKTEPSPVATPDEPVVAKPQTATLETPQSSDLAKQQVGSAAAGPSRARPAVAEVRPRTDAKPIAAETAPKPRKKVTVDDLISDN